MHPFQPILGCAQRYSSGYAVEIHDQLSLNGHETLSTDQRAAWVYAVGFPFHIVHGDENHAFMTTSAEGNEAFDLKCTVNVFQFTVDPVAYQGAIPTENKHSWLDRTSPMSWHQISRICNCLVPRTTFTGMALRIPTLYGYIADGATGPLDCGTVSTLTSYVAIVMNAESCWVRSGARRQLDTGM